MDILFTVVVSAGLFLLLELSWRPRWFGDRQPEETRADETGLEGGLFTWSFVRRRLDALAQELERLDRDPDVFAKAFHTQVARAAYEALLADAARFADEPPRSAGHSLDVQLVRTSRGMREELEL